MNHPDDLEPGVDAVGVLADPLRRAAYRTVVASGRVPVGRDDVAAALKISRALAAFHLDKLVDAGLVEVSYARRSGRTGPGAGRPAKLYRQAAGEIAVSVPPRGYRSAAVLLAEAVERAGADTVLFETARISGQAIGADRVDLFAVLTEQGYAPEVDGAVVRLRNCPFHLLAEQFPPLVCGMNLALLDGVLDGAGLAGWQARLEPASGRCCVALSKTRNN